LMSGELDPVGGMGEKVKNLYSLYQSLGLNVTMKLYENVRHELTSDYDREAIIADIIRFFDNNLQGGRGA